MGDLGKDKVVNYNCSIRVRVSEDYFLIFDCVWVRNKRWKFSTGKSLEKKIVRG